MWHSSTYNITDTHLYPHPSAVLNGESAVFAANKKYISMIFLARWSDEDIFFASDDSTWFAIERYPGAFQKIFSNKSGYIYKVDPEGFASDPRLGLQHAEFINRNKVAILKKIYIGDVWAELQKTPIHFITFEEHIFMIGACLRRGK